jgi:hypothetical protein
LFWLSLQASHHQAQVARAVAQTKTAGKSRRLSSCSGRKPLSVIVEPELKLLQPGFWQVEKATHGFTLRITRIDTHSGKLIAAEHCQSVAFAPYLPGKMDHFQNVAWGLHGCVKVLSAAKNVKKCCAHDHPPSDVLIISMSV